MMMKVSEKIMEVLKQESANLLTSLAAINEVRFALSEELVRRLGEAKQEVEQNRARLKQFHIERGVDTINDPECGEILYGALQTDDRGCISPIYVWANDREEAARLISVVTTDWDWLGEVNEDGEFVRF